MIGQNGVIAENFKVVPTAVMSDALIVLVWGMPWHQTGVTHCHTQLGLPDNGSAI